MPRSKGIPRREALQIGFSGLLGLGLPQLARANPVSRPKSVLLIFLTGASSHLDTFDLKPESPDGIRGEFKPVATSVPGIQVCEHLPLLAQRAHQYALVRSMAHKENNHLVATHHTLTGHPQPGAFFDKVASRDDWPSYAATLNYLHARGDGLPSGVNLPTFLVEGALTWPGQHAGFIGPRHDPWQITQDPARPGFKVDNLSVSQGLTIGRIRDRAGILKSLDLKQKALEQSPAPGRLREQQEMALAMLGSGKLAQAFDLDQEPVASREKYGRHAFGQSILLARRLLQAGVPVVQANMGRVQNWDTHGENFTRLKNSLLPPLDRGVAALLDDLTATGMIEDTLVIVTGEFGRTPKISFQPGANNSQPGRDHWAQCYTALFAGAGVRGGQVIGRSDKIGAYPATIPYTPDDLGATVYHTLGIDPETHVRDRQNRPSQLNRGKVIEPLFNGSHGA
ncbi:MAG: DUF1501 domain-containing protein [Gemmataceae bacterium]|nr:DUF1501 domain-containing protein [Gemmataceae bacterium]